jgi:quinone-modifying oxidoreductase subunit QmoC
MAALRDYSIAHYATPKFMGTALASPRYLPALVAVPVVIFAAVLASLGNLTALPAGTIVYSKFMPIRHIEVIFTAAIALSACAALIGGMRYWKAMETQSHRGRRAVLPTVLTILRHRRFKDCGDSGRPTGKEHLHRMHLMVFYGFLGLVVTTASVGIGIYAFGYLTPWPVWHPVKILGNVSGAAVIAATSVFSYRRIVDKANAGKNTYSDQLFLGALLSTAATGFLSELLRLSGLRELAYPTYFVHLVAIFFLLVYAPYTKLAHVIYRTAAMVHEPRLSDPPV